MCREDADGWKRLIPGTVGPERAVWGIGEAREGPRSVARKKTGLYLVNQMLP